MKHHIKNYASFCWLTTSLIVAGACSGDEISQKKLAARDSGGFGNAGQDLCAQNDWYGDGECDFFCPQYDEQDCGDVCPTVLPACDDGERSVSAQECETLPGCRKITSCGGTVYCADDEPDVCTAHAPACMRDGEFVDPVDPSECNEPDSCTRHETCGGGVYYCKNEPACDVAVAPCPAGTRPGTAAECETRNDCTVYNVEECDTKSYCVPEATDECYVGGCSGQFCTDQPDGPDSTCEWQEEYACYHDATCERQNDGSCGWTQTEELNACIEGSK